MRSDEAERFVEAQRVVPAFVRGQLDQTTTPLAGPLDPDAYWPFSDTISGSRWPGFHGGPKKAR